MTRDRALSLHTHQSIAPRGRAGRVHSEMAVRGRRRAQKTEDRSLLCRRWSSSTLCTINSTSFPCSLSLSLCISLSSLERPASLEAGEAGLTLREGERERTRAGWWRAGRSVLLPWGKKCATPLFEVESRYDEANNLPRLSFLALSCFSLSLSLSVLSSCLQNKK